MKQQKNAFLPKILPNLKYYNAQTDKYAVRFSSAYKAAGHDFIKSFKVVREVYFFKYGLITYDDVSFYDHLHFLADADWSFTLDQLADQTGKGKATLREILDRLENVELIETIKVQEAKGNARNYYMIKTPLFERDSIEQPAGVPISDEEKEKSVQQRRRERIKTAKEELPVVYLEDCLEQFRQNLHEVKEDKNNPETKVVLNRAARRRKEATADTRAQQKRNWSALIHELKGAAIEFDNLICRTYNYLRGRKDVDADAASWTTFDAIIKNECKKLGIRISQALLKQAREIYLFYQRWNEIAPAATTRTTPRDSRNAARRTVSQTPPTPAKNEQEEIVELELDMMRSIFAKPENIKLWRLDAISDFVRYFKQKIEEGITFAQLKTIAAPALGVEKWTLIEQELLI